jgi:hypothetical protein
VGLRRKMKKLFPNKVERKENFYYIGGRVKGSFKSIASWADRVSN